MKMVIKRAQKEDADIIGEVHSAAWKQTYQGVFSQEYLDSDSPSARREEFLSSLNDRHCVYLLLKDDEQASGIVKLLVNRNDIEVASFYILEEYRGRGFGRKILEYIFSEYKDRHFVLWVLETNLNARAFYEKCGFELTDKTRLIDRGGEFKQLMYERK
ncbi:MAG: GNAT family N-acetyltransferase [Lachnospiraceae bacterium]|nr:GNAT family N-acetyltransferase [Lachnospiraceae bacterium]